MIPWDKLALSHSVGMADHTRHTSLPKVRGHNQMLKWYVLPKSPTVHQPFEYCGSSLWDFKILIPHMITCCHHPSHIAETMRPAILPLVTISSWPLFIHHWWPPSKKPDKDGAHPMLYDPSCREPENTIQSRFVIYPSKLISADWGGRVNFQNMII